MDTLTVTLEGPAQDKQRVWRVLNLLQRPSEWEGDAPKVRLVWRAEDGTNTVQEPE